MPPPDRPPLVAPIAGFAAWRIAQALDRDLEGMVVALIAGGAAPGYVAELRQAHRALRAAGEQWQEWRASVNGSAEAPETEMAPSSQDQISTSEAAEVLGVTESRVRQLLRSMPEVFDAVRVRGRWALSRSAVLTYRSGRAA